MKRLYKCCECDARITQTCKRVYGGMCWKCAEFEALRGTFVYTR